MLAHPGVLPVSGLEGRSSTQLYGALDHTAQVSHAFQGAATSGRHGDRQSWLQGCEGVVLLPSLCLELCVCHAGSRALVAGGLQAGKQLC